MSAYIVQPPFEIFTDIDGQPLEAGFVWIGAANLDPQTNPIAVYFDQALTIPAVQPLRTNSGYIVNSGTPAQIFVNAVSYSIRVMNKNGSTLYTLLNATSIDPNASGIEYTPAGTGAVATTVQTKLREVVSVLDFGADPTGVSDCSVTVQNAIAYARTKSGSTNAGGVNATTKSAIILFPPGSYKFTSTVLVPPNMTFMGDGATILCNESGSTFETGYYNSGVLTSNWSLSDVDVVNYGLTGLRFENLTFYRGDVALKLRCAIWQSGVFNCQFYETHIAIDSKQCFYSTYDNITIRGDNPGFTAAEGIRFMRATNRVLVNNVGISYRDRGIVIGETGTANASAQIAITNCSLEVLLYGIEFVGNFYTVDISDMYLESVDNVFWDQDGALKYNINIDKCYSNSTTYFVDMSGLRDSYIGPIRDNSALSSVKAVVRLRQGTYGNAAIVELSNLGDPDTGTNRYQLSDGVITSGALTKYTSGSTAVVLGQNRQKNTLVSQYADQLPINDTGWYGIAVNFVIGSQTGTVVNTAGTEMYFNTKFWWSEYTSVNYAVKVTPNAGSGAGGTTPSPIYLKGISIGSHVTQIGTAGHTAYSTLDSASGCMRLSFDGFGTSSSDPAYAWMRNGLYTSEGIAKLIA